MSLNFRIVFLSTVAAVLVAACGSAPAQSWSGLAVNPESGTVYVTRGTHLYALTANGTKQWQFPADGANTVGEFYADPALSGDTLILTSYNKSVYALDAKTGVQKWSYPAAGASAGFILPWDTNPEAPADRLIAPASVHGDTVYVPSADGSLYALDLNGGLKWKFSTGASLWGAAVPAGERVYVSSMDRNLYALEAATGTQRWAAPLDGAIAGAPALSADGSTLFVGTLNNTLYAIEAETGAELWTVTADGWVWSTPLAADDTLYFGDMKGSVFAVAAATGAVRWKVQPGGPVRGTPVLAGQSLIVPTDNGFVYSLSLADGSKLWEHEIQANNADRLLANPVLVNETVIIAPLAAENLLYALDVNTGEVVWTFNP